mgnify:CR=1 FL=1
MIGMLTNPELVNSDAQDVGFTSGWWFYKQQPEVSHCEAYFIQLGFSRFHPFTEQCVVLFFEAITGRAPRFLH